MCEEFYTNSPLVNILKCSNYFLLVFKLEAEFHLVLMKFWKISECVGWEDVFSIPEVCVSEHLVPHHFVLFSNLKIIS